MRELILEIMARELEIWDLLETDKFRDLNVDLMAEDSVREAIERETGIVIYEHDGFAVYKTVGEYMDMVMTYM